MASSHGTPPVFNNKVIAWIDHRLPIFRYIEKEYHTFPTPRNFNYFWNFGAIATVMLVLMIVTGIVLAMQLHAARRPWPSTRSSASCATCRRAG